MFKANDLKRKLKQVGLQQIVIVALSSLLMISIFATIITTSNYKNTNIKLTASNTNLTLMLENVRQEIENLKSTDQIKRNDDLQAEIINIQKTYNQALGVYEKLLDFRDKTKNTTSLDAKFAQSLSKLSNKDYELASTLLRQITSEIVTKEQEIAAAFVIPDNTVESTIPPASGYSRQTVPTAIGNYLVSLVAADSATTRVVIDTASNNNCTSDCPVLSLADYVARNGAYAGINGTYFCPASYPSCTGKTNSFDLLVMNKDKTYFNSDNNIYSSNPGVIFGNGFVRFVSSISQWGRDTSVNGVISNFPLLVFNNNSFAGDDDPKKGSKAGRSFVANKGNTVYIGIVHNSTVAEAATVLTAMGMENAINLDSGGSTALWSGGYKTGPGRDIPNAILFLSK